MAGQICRTCKYKNDLCYCSPNSTCSNYEEDIVTKAEDFVRCVEKDKMKDSMIRASKKQELQESKYSTHFLRKRG